MTNSRLVQILLTVPLAGFRLQLGLIGGLRTEILPIQNTQLPNNTCNFAVIRIVNFKYN